jgi:hypothetical protein
MSGAHIPYGKEGIFVSGHTIWRVDMKTLAKLLFFFLLFPGVARMGFSRGDKVIPQVVNAAGWSTTFDLTNVSPSQAITNMVLSFYKNDGSKWSVQTNQGTGSDFTLSIGARQTLRVQTTGGTEGSGYAVLYDYETGNSTYSADYVLGISAYYTYSNDSGIVDTVTISVPQPTGAATIPVQVNHPNIDSGFAIVNWAGKSIPITIALYDSLGALKNSASFTLKNNEQRTEFLYEKLFPGLDAFKGMAEITSTDGPFAVLGLLQTTAAAGAQYSTLASVDKESLRSNSYVAFLQAPTYTNTVMPLDIDQFTSDYFRKKGNTSGDVDDWSWDIQYMWDSPATTSPYFRPVNGAQIVSLGYKTDADFDVISLPTLKGLTYSTQDIDLTGTANLYLWRAFAVRTDRGNYAKFRIAMIIDDKDPTQGRPLQHLVLEVAVYK